MEQAGLDVLHVEDVTRSYVLTVNRWIDNVRRHRDRIDALAPGFAQILQTYMTIGRLSFHRRSALESMILPVKGHPPPSRTRPCSTGSPRPPIGAWTGRPVSFAPATTGRPGRGLSTGIVRAGPRAVCGHRA